MLQHAYALEMMESRLQSGARALDVGSGSGYLTVCMAEMVGKEGRVYGIEHIPQLVVRAYILIFSHKSLRYPDLCCQMIHSSTCVHRNVHVAAHWPTEKTWSIPNDCNS